MRLATDEQADEIYGEAREWAEGKTAIHFSDEKYVAFMAVSEYIANKSGLTLYKTTAQS